MLVLVGALIAVAPFAVVIGLFAWTSWRERRHREVQDVQIALTDAIHERLGAAAAPVVRRRRRVWRVSMAVPFQRPIVIEALLAIVLEGFAPDDHDPRSLEITLTKQPHTQATKLASGVGRESLSWT